MTITMEDFKYYLFYRMDDGEWKSVFYRSFLTNTSMKNIYGQFTSSSWFNIIIDHVNTIDLMIVRLNTVMRLSHDLICEQICSSDVVPDFVVAHELFVIDELKQNLSTKLLEGNHQHLVHKETRGQMGVSFHAIRMRENSVQYTLCCPTFVI